MAELGISHQYRQEIGYGHASRMIGENLPRVFEVVSGASSGGVGRSDVPSPHASDSAIGGSALLAKTETWPKLARLDAVPLKRMGTFASTRTTLRVLLFT